MIRRSLVLLFVPLVACGQAGVDVCDAAGVCGDLAGASLADLAGVGEPARDMSLAATAPPDLAGYTPAPAIVARPYASYAPASLDPSVAAPLIVALHGYTSSGQHIEDYFQLMALADEYGILLATPEGTKDGVGQKFWYATDGCCDLFFKKPDDSAYLTAVIDDMAARYRVDPKRVFVVGHSNGGFMSHRMACDHADRVAAIVAMSGDDWKDTTKCTPSTSVAVLQIHGDNDPTIHYTGGQNFPLAAYPAAADSVAGWAMKNGCTTHDDSLAPLDLSADQAGAETVRQVYGGCPANLNGAAELWTIHGAVHEPKLNPGFGDTIWGFLSAHPKP